MNPTLLYDEASEKNVIGCMFSEPSVIDEVTEILSVDDFFVSSHREVFRAILALITDKKPVEVQLLHLKLVEFGVAESISSPGILAEMATAFASHLTVGSYARIVKDKSRLRSLQSACESIAEDLADMPGSVAEVIDRAQARIGKIAAGDSRPSISRVNEAVDRWMDNQAKVQVGEVESRLATGFREFDAMNGGLTPAGMHVIAGRPGTGKSDWMFSCLRNLCRRGIPVGIIQLEMTEGMMIERLMSDGAGIDSRRFHGPMHEGEWEKLYEAQAGAENWKMHMECASHFDVNDLRRSVRSLIRVGAKALMVDYLQLLRSLETKYGNREQALAEISRTIKGFTLEFGIPILIGSQLNRIDAGGKQGLHNLRESDSIGNDADVVIVLRKKNPDDPSTRAEMIVDVTKFRNGATGEIVMFFDMPRHRYEDAI